MKCILCNEWHTKPQSIEDYKFALCERHYIMQEDNAIEFDNTIRNELSKVTIKRNEINLLFNTLNELLRVHEENFK